MSGDRRTAQEQRGTQEIILIHHTDCGMLTFSDDEVKAKTTAETGKLREVDLS